MTATLERTITIDRLLAQRADRKLRQYGWTMDDAIARTLIAIVTIPGAPEKAFPAEAEASIARATPLMRKLCALPRLYSRPDWDGYGANPISKASLVHAKGFAKRLASDICPTDVGIDADGEVTFEWYHSKESHCSLTFSATGNVYCIVRFNGERISATMSARDVLGAADIARHAIEAQGLKVRRAPTCSLPHHAEIYAWPQGDTEEMKQLRIGLATDLADAARYFPKGSVK